MTASAFFCSYLLKCYKNLKHFVLLSLWISVKNPKERVEFVDFAIENPSLYNLPYHLKYS